MDDYRMAALVVPISLVALTSANLGSILYMILLAAVLFVIEVIFYYIPGVSLSSLFM